MDGRKGERVAAQPKLEETLVRQRRQRALATQDAHDEEEAQAHEAEEAEADGELPQEDRKVAAGATVEAHPAAGAEVEQEVLDEAQKRQRALEAEEAEAQAWIAGLRGDEARELYFQRGSRTVLENRILGQQILNSLPAHSRTPEEEFKFIIGLSLVAGTDISAGLRRTRSMTSSSGMGWPRVSEW